MDFLLGLDQKTVFLLPATMLCFVCAVIVHKNKKKLETDAYQKLSHGLRSQGYADRENALKGNMPLKDDWEGQNLRDVEDVRSGMGGVVGVRYLDWFFVLCGVFFAMTFCQRLFGGEQTDAFMGWFAVGVVIVGCIGTGVILCLQNAMGNETKKITGKVIKAYKRPRYSSYRIEVMWTDDKQRIRNHRCRYAFRKRKCPKVGDEYEMIYSYKYDKVISRDEIRQNRKNSFYCFAMVVFWIIIIWVRIGLY